MYKLIFDGTDGSCISVTNGDTTSLSYTCKLYSTQVNLYDCEDMIKNIFSFLDVLLLNMKKANNKKHKMIGMYLCDLSKDSDYDSEYNYSLIIKFEGEEKFFTQLEFDYLDEDSNKYFNEKFGTKFTLVSDSEDDKYDDLLDYYNSFLYMISRNNRYFKYKKYKIYTNDKICNEKEMVDSVVDNMKDLGSDEAFISNIYENKLFCVCTRRRSNFITSLILCFKVDGKYITIDMDKKIAIPYLLSCGIVKEADIKNVLDIILNIKKSVKQGIF